MLDFIYSILATLIIILIILHSVMIRKLGNTTNKIIRNIKIRLVIAIMLSVMLIIYTSIQIIIRVHAIIIVISIMATINWETNVDRGIRALKIYKEKLECNDNTN
ncbi:MAG: hypothetical protein IJE05_06460 [Clostridia bacterium]|nr:hypothetical protein [Clostridia bacterium]